MNIVTLGGGTGQYHTLRALMYLKTELCTAHPIHITAIPTTTDNGGSSGTLRFDYKIVAPGDIGQCILGLHPKPEEVAWLFEHRFSGGGLNGHTTRNIIVTTALKVHGPNQSALDAVRDTFKLAGDICPATFTEAHVRVQLANGKVLLCEDELYRENILASGGVEQVWLEPNVTPVNKRSVEAIHHADVIVVCPGTLYCSIIPNFLVREIKEALCESSAQKIYVANLMNQRGHIPKDWTAFDHMRCINGYLQEDFFDVVIVNEQEPSQNQALLYGKEKVFVSSSQHFGDLSCTVISAPLIMCEPSVSKNNSGDMLAHLRASVRHDKKRLAIALQRALVQANMHMVCDMSYSW